MVQKGSSTNPYYYWQQQGTYPPKQHGRCPSCGVCRCCGRGVGTSPPYWQYPNITYNISGPSQD